MDSHLELCLVPRSDDLKPSHSIVPPGVERDALLAKMGALFGARAGAAPRFPGSQPMSMRRRETSRLCGGYLVALKSDGIRFILLLTQYMGEPRAVMNDRRLDVYEVEVWANKSFFDNTAFDGELVWDHSEHPSRLSYLVFDTVSMRGRACGALRYSERLGMAHSAVLRTVPDAMTGADLERFMIDEDKILPMGNLHGMRMAPKRVLPAQHVLAIWEGRSLSPHLNDGLVFTHDGPLGERATFKWKPDNTVDLLLRLDDRCVEAFVNRGAGRVRLHHVPFAGDHLRVRVRRNHMLECTLLAARRAGAGRWVEAVVECLCTVDPPGAGGGVEYTPVKHRPDKGRANSMHTVTETLYEVVESVSVHDLQRIICAASDSPERGHRGAPLPPPPPPVPSPPPPPPPVPPPVPRAAPREDVPAFRLGAVFANARALPAAP